MYGDAGVELALRRGFPVLTMLERYCGLQWTTLVPGTETELDGSSLSVESFAVGGDAPRYLDGSGDRTRSQRMVFRDQATDAVVTYVPGLARFDDAIRDRFAASDLVLVDGTFWTDDELPRLGFSQTRRARDGPSAAVGPRGHNRGAVGLDPARKVLVHINNTNPILLDDSRSGPRCAMRASKSGMTGWRCCYDRSAARAR